MCGNNCRNINRILCVGGNADFCGDTAGIVCACVRIYNYLQSAVNVFPNSPIAHTNSPLSHTNSPLIHTNSPLTHTNSPLAHTNSLLAHQYLVTFTSTQLNALHCAALTAHALTEVQDRNFVTVTNSAAENPGVGKQMLLGNQQVTQIPC